VTNPNLSACAPAAGLSARLVQQLPDSDFRRKLVGIGNRTAISNDREVGRPWGMRRRNSRFKGISGAKVLRDTDRYIAIHDASRYVRADVTAAVASAHRIRARAREVRLRSGQLRARAQQLSRMRSTVDGFEPQVSFSPRPVNLGLLDWHSDGCTDEDQRRRRGGIRPPLRAAGVLDRAAGKSNVPDELDPDEIRATVHRDNSDSIRPLRIQSFPLPGAPVEGNPTRLDGAST
jgi:hypothetical protein